MLFSPWTGDALDFTNGLIQRKKHRRLGQNGIQELKQHSWFRHFPWKYLMKRILRPEYIPSKNRDNFDPRNVNKKDPPLDPDSVGLLKRRDIQKMFENYYYEPGKVKEVCLTTRASEGTGP